jgi:hydroxyacylglutathione hydrolase
MAILYTLEGGGTMKPRSMILKQVELGPMMNFIYLIGCPSTGDGAVIDPAWDVPAILNIAQETHLKIRYILMTHGHPDHINGLDPLLKATGAKVILHSSELAYLKKNARNFGMPIEFLERYSNNIQPVLDGAILPLGNLSIQCLHTPGHSPGSQCFLVENCLFSGDTLFVDACGRVDIPGGNPKEMWRSLNQILRALPDETILYPGHDYGGSPKSTMGEQKRSNPYMRYDSEEQFIRDMR